jgi:hypothetical protein
MPSFCSSKKNIKDVESLKIAIYRFEEFKSREGNDRFVRKVMELRDRQFN